MTTPNEIMPGCQGPNNPWLRGFCPQDAAGLPRMVWTCQDTFTQRGGKGMSSRGHWGTVCLLGDPIPSGSARHLGRTAAPGRLLCSSYPALPLVGFSPSPLMPVGCVQWDFKGACNVETPV